MAAVPVPGIGCTNAAGQVYLKGNVHVLRIVSTNVQIAGRLTAWMDLANQTNGTAIFVGPAYSEVGTWAGTQFNPSGGVWDLKYTGLAQADGSDVIHMVGYGIGGAIDRLQIELTATKGLGLPFDPAVPYFAAGIVKPAPVDSTIVLDNFNDGIQDPRWIPWSTGTPQLSEANGQFTVRGLWSRRADQLLDHSGGYFNTNWSIADGQTMEWRADVVSMNQDAAGVGLGVGTSNTRYYMLGLARQSINLYRFTANNGRFEPLLNDPVTVKQTGIVLSFALTRRQSQASITVRVIDGAAPNDVLYQTNLLDSAPYLDGDNVVLAVAPDPELPSSNAAVTFDNLVRRVYEIPSVAIQRAVRLQWPATGTSYVVEGARYVEGPYLPVQDSNSPGFEQRIFPQDHLMEYFRLRQAP
ncbi:MAG TPA: hypothetical protein VG167_13195 [Verrucomicrobiae bacterium]|nr:hypothetical protein [Verrucomicrobiae bacterium]